MKVMNFRLLCITIIISCLSNVHAEPGSMPILSISMDGLEVTDISTGLIWRRCVEGMSWNNGTCTGSVVTYDHTNALLHAQSEASISGKSWRLPNVKELESIVNIIRVNPAVDITAFPVTPSSYFWSSSANVDKSNYAWLVGFDRGYVYRDLRSNYYAVRLVRTAQ